MNQQTTKPLRKIAILMAMHDEANPIIDALQLVLNRAVVHPRLPMRCYQRQIDALHVSLLVSGIDDRYNVDNVGCEAATLMAYEAASKLTPDIIVSAGTAGGFASLGACIGTVYLSGQCFVYHDRHVPLPGFDLSAVSRYPALAIDRLAADLDLPQGIISTGSSLERNDKDLLCINHHQAVAKDMEAAAVAWVAMLFNIPVFAIKAITNLLDQATESQIAFVDNLTLASQHLKDKTLALVDYLSGKSIQDLGTHRK